MQLWYEIIKITFIIANIIKDNGTGKLFSKLFQNNNNICWRLFPFDQPWNNVLIQRKQQWARPGTLYGGPDHTKLMRHRLFPARLITH